VGTALEVEETVMAVAAMGAAMTAVVVEVAVVRALEILWVNLSRR